MTLMRLTPPTLTRGARFVALLLLSAGAAEAAVTNRAATPEDSPRAAWLERYQDSRQGPEQTDRFTRSSKVGDGAALDLVNIAGNVRITGGPGGEIRVEAIKRVRHRDADTARRLLDELRVEINQSGDRVEVRTIHPRSSNNMRNVSISVDYVISVPAGATATLKTISGDVAVSGVRGEVRAETISGDVDLAGTPNVAVGKTVSGEVRARDIGGAGTLTLGTVSGAVIASGLKVRTLECGSVSGDIHLSAVQVERVLGKTVSGNIEFDSALNKDGRYELTSHSGNVRVLLPANAAFDLNASTFSGSVRTDFPVTLQSSGDAGRRGGTRTIRGMAGTGGAILSVQSFSGSVVIVKK